MNVITAGHKYLISNFENEGDVQSLQFIEKEKAETGELVTVVDGTTNEEVLCVLIDRLQFLNKLQPCRENSIVITKLEESLMWLDKRTADRAARHVEGKALP